MERNGKHLVRLKDQWSRKGCKRKGKEEASHDKKWGTKEGQQKKELYSRK
jgi:hypothetical protein